MGHRQATGLAIGAAILVAASGTMPAQAPKPIFDGRLTLKPTAPAPAEVALLKEKVLPAAKKAWHKQERGALCTGGVDGVAVDIAAGAFTKPRADQKALLYRYCTIGHEMVLNGIAILEGGRVVAHVIFEGGESHAIGALPDINGNGLAEILLASGGTNQGITWGTMAIIELGGAEITEFGQTDTFSDDQGANDKNGKVKANRISVKFGTKPEFFRDSFIATGAGQGAGAWRKVGVQAPITLEEDKAEYELLQ